MVTATFTVFSLQAWALNKTDPLVLKKADPLLARANTVFFIKYIYLFFFGGKRQVDESQGYRGLILRTVSSLGFHPLGVYSVEPGGSFLVSTGGSK